MPDPKNTATYHQDGDEEPNTAVEARSSHSIPVGAATPEGLIASPFATAPLEHASKTTSHTEEPQTGTPTTPFVPPIAIGNLPRISSPLRRGCLTEAPSQSHFPRVPSLFSRPSDDRAAANAPVTGGAHLPPEASPGAPSPTTVRKTKLEKSFRVAKLQVNRDLVAFLAELRREAAAAKIPNKISEESSGGSAATSSSSDEDEEDPSLAQQEAEEEDVAREHAIQTAQRCLDEDVDSFKENIKAEIDRLEELRRSFHGRPAKRLYTRLLFILTRCSRLVLSEDYSPGVAGTAGYYTAIRAVRDSRRARGLQSTAAPRGRGSDERSSLDQHRRRISIPSPRSRLGSPLVRSATAPSRSLRDALQRMHISGGDGGGSSGGSRSSHLSPTPESPPSLAPLSPRSPRTLGLSTGSGGGGGTSHRTAAMSPLGRSVVTALEPHLDSAVPSPRSTSSPRRSPSPLGPLAASFMSGQQQQQKQDEKDVEITTKSSPQVPQLANLMNLNNQQQRGTPLELQKWRRHTTDGATGATTPRALAPSLSSPASSSPADSSSLPSSAAATPRAYSLGMPLSEGSPASPSGKKPPLHPGLARRLTVALPVSPSGSPMTSPGSSARSLVCRICEESVHRDCFESHSAVCVTLDHVCRHEKDVDIILTRLGDAAEERLAEKESSGAPHAELDLEDVIAACRQAAALQPDGTRLPAERCETVASTLAAACSARACPKTTVEVISEAFMLRALGLVRRKAAELLAAAPGGTAAATAGTSEGSLSAASTPASQFGSMSIDDFEIIKPISRGAFGRVYLARKRATGDLYAIKVMRKADLVRKNMVQSARNERNILAMANNSFVVRFFYSFTSRDNLYIVMEYAPGGDLASLLQALGALEEDTARQYAAEATLALEYCHAQGIIHRDLKPDNVLISVDGHVKLTDFGLSCFGVIDRTDPHPRALGYDSGSLPSSPNGKLLRATAASAPDLLQSPASKADLRAAVTAAAAIASPRLMAGGDEGRQAVGTPDYLAPELLLGTGHGLEADWWSLGVVLFEMVVGTPPFSASTPEGIFQNILERNIAWPPAGCLSPELADLLDRLLEPDPEHRLGHRGAAEVKMHPWFAGVDWAGLARQKAAFVPEPSDETDTSYFISSKEVSQMSLALDLDSVRSTRSTAAGGVAPPWAGGGNLNLHHPLGSGLSSEPSSALQSPTGLPPPPRRAFKKRSLRHVLSVQSTETSASGGNTGCSSRASLTEENTLLLSQAGSSAAAALNSNVNATIAAAAEVLMQQHALGGLPSARSGAQTLSRASSYQEAVLAESLYEEEREEGGNRSSDGGAFSIQEDQIFNQFDPAAPGTTPPGNFHGFSFKNVGPLTERNLTALKTTWDDDEIRPDYAAMLEDGQISPMSAAAALQAGDPSLWDEFDRPPDLETIRSMSAASSPVKMPSIGSSRFGGSGSLGSLPLAPPSEMENNNNDDEEE